jgi:uncharacterized membrane protein
LNISRQTVTRYVAQLEKSWIVKNIKIGRNSLLFVPQFIDLLS